MREKLLSRVGVLKKALGFFVAPYAFFAMLSALHVYHMLLETMHNVGPSSKP